MGRKNPEETRRRIVTATRELHEEVGPASTTISAIAERAGVQRLTVYRHFPDDAALLGACSSDWNADHPLPDPGLWTGIADPEERVRTALEALYAYYRRGRPMLESILRDESEVPELAEVMQPWWQYLGEVAGALSVGWRSGENPAGGGWKEGGDDSGSAKRLRAAIGHAIRFYSWRSLAEEGLDDAVAAEMMVDLIVAQVGSRVDR